MTVLITLTTFILYETKIEVEHYTNLSQIQIHMHI
jgi:hypothetical protein